MKVYEVGVFCQYEGGGVSAVIHNNSGALAKAKAWLSEYLKNDIAFAFDDEELKQFNDFEINNIHRDRKELLENIEQINQVATIEALNGIKINGYRVINVRLSDVL